MIQLRAIPGPTGRMIREMLTAKGLLEGEVRGVVNYGYAGGSPLPCLNARAGTIDKFEELEMLRAKGVATVPFSRSPLDLVAPLMGRSVHHTRGNDIRVYRVRPLTLQEHGHDYFTQLVPKQREFRVWSFRRIPIATYEKILAYPNKLGRRGRSRDVWNYRNGYAYEFRHPDTVDVALKALGASAVEALGLDFGAVEIIRSIEGNYLTLEVNTAPGTEGPRYGVSSLVNHIEKWARGGFKRRNGDGQDRV